MAITVNKVMSKEDFANKFAMSIVRFGTQDVDWSTGIARCMFDDLNENGAFSEFYNDRGEKIITLICEKTTDELEDMLNKLKEHTTYYHIRKLSDWLDAQKAIEGRWEILDDDTGEIIDDDDYEYINGAFYSKDTVESRWTRCERCGDWTRIDETTTVYVADYDTQVWCEDCTSYNTWRCECCGEHFSEYDVLYTEVRDYGCVCNDCIENDGFVQCPECGDYVYYESYNEDEGMCEYCLERRRRNEARKWGIRDYHDAPLLKWYGEKDARSACYMGTGFELEIDNGERRNEAAKFIYDMLGEQVYFERDGSLGYTGFEIISQPMTDKYMRKTFLPQIDSVFDRLVKEYNYRSHDTDSCGLHFHFSRELFGKGENRERALEKFTLFFEDYWEDLVKFSRRSSSGLSWCYPYSRDFHDAKEREKDIKDMCKGKKYLSHGDRYHAVNFTNARTIEVRLMKGTLNPDTFRACYDFLITLVKNSKKVKYSDRHNLAKWFKGMKPETIEFMKSRSAFNAYTATVA